ncbi:MAG: TonB-dependent receptor [Bacteroidota bacterium]|jgi:outer membrane receptor for ferrienterochelin and colicin|nr:TonB-dependent receptor [Bacteroidota bacterium]
MHGSRLFLIFLTFISLSLYSATAQHLHGTIHGEQDGSRTELRGAHVFWIGTTHGAVSDAHGQFHLDADGVTDRRLVISHVAFEPETLDVADRDDIAVVLTRPRSTGEVQVEAKAPETYIAPIEQKTEVITAEELEHAACCDLSGCFGTTSSVQSEAVDIITDTKQLKMLGLEGVYSQVLLDNVPALASGLNTHLGVSFIPGPFIDRIMVSKGTSSVLQGPESFSGLINVLLRDSDRDEPLFFNAFANSFLEQQYNAYVMRTFGNWSGMLALHGVRRGLKHDGNADGFLDMPLTDRFSALAKWKYHGEAEGIIANTGVKYTWEDRIGGQEAYDVPTHRGGDLIFGQTMRNNRIELFNRTEFDLGDGDALKLHLGGSMHDQDSWYGSTRYTAEEQVFYGDAAWASPWFEEHTITAGVSLLVNRLDETVDLGRNPLGKTYGGTYTADVVAPGVFAEHKSNFLDDALTIVAGARADFRNDEGTIFTPRLFARYALDELTTLRASVGSAFRVARMFVQHPAALASWRDIRFEADLDPERAWTYGLSVTRYYALGSLTGTFNIDVYRSNFSAQVVAEYDDDPALIVFRNIDGTSTADNVMAEITGDIAPFLFRFSYTFADVYETRDGMHRSLPFVTRDRLLGVITAKSADEAWQTTLTAEWRGAQKLPRTSAYPEEFQLPEFGDAYLLLHLHVQRSWEAFDLYAGAENLLDFRQDNPILNAANPFQSYFEPGFAWGPVKGREIYAGIRARLNVF